MQQFNEILKYTMVPMILMDSLFMFCMVIIAFYSYGLYFIKSAYIGFYVLHILGLLTGVFSFAMILIMDKYGSSEFDYYEES
mmetsp:Transcript_42859/g.50262  ORF Transcript_42859/g.50262 Transcript_42859/m.50262 type:complete len:82 (+) Transcript_42859:1011-1256(+)